MPGEDKNLTETISEVFEETKSQPAETKENETGSELSEGKGDETKSGETSSYQGIDISDIPEQDRPRVMKFLKDKAALADVGIQKKFQEIAPLKKAMEDISKMGLTLEEAKAAIIEKAQNKNKPLNVGEKKTIRLLDQLLEASPAEQKESLRQMRQIVNEEAEDAPTVKELREKVASMEKMLGMVSNSALEVKRKEINQDLDTTFTKKYGKDFIEKHKDKILEVALKNPNVPIEKIIKFETPDEEYEQALLAQKLGNKKPLTEEKKNAISSTGQGVNISHDNIDTNKEWTGFLHDLVTK